MGTTHQISVEVPPCTAMTIREMFKKSELSIPYTLTLTYSTGEEKDLETALW